MHSRRQTVPAASGIADRGITKIGKGIAAMSLGLIFFGIASLNAAEPAALTGVVSSDAEKVMEGVLISAKRVSGTITVTVVSNHDGRYEFPASRLSAGKYQLSVRATGLRDGKSEPRGDSGKKREPRRYSASEDGRSRFPAHGFRVADEHAGRARTESKIVCRLHDLPHARPDNEKRLR